jgi:hypothetical protein
MNVINTDYRPSEYSHALIRTTPVNDKLPVTLVVKSANSILLLTVHAQ